MRGALGSDSRARVACASRGAPLERELELRDGVAQLLLAVARRLQQRLLVRQLGRQHALLERAARAGILAVALQLGVEDFGRDGLHANRLLEHAQPRQPIGVRRRGEDQHVLLVDEHLEDELIARLRQCELNATGMQKLGEDLQIGLGGVFGARIIKRAADEREPPPVPIGEATSA